MNRRCPTERLSTDHAKKLDTLVDERGEREALRLAGINSAETLYKAIARRPVARQTAEVIGFRLDRI